MGPQDHGGVGWAPPSSPPPGRPCGMTPAPRREAIATGTRGGLSLVWCRALLGRRRRWGRRPASGQQGRRGVGRPRSRETVRKRGVRIDMRRPDLPFREVLTPVELGAPEVGVPEVGAPEVGALEVGAPEVGALEVGALEVGEGCVGVAEVHLYQPLAFEVCPKNIQRPREPLGRTTTVVRCGGRAMNWSIIAAIQPRISPITTQSGRFHRRWEAIDFKKKIF
jgi:hypothetical protein